MAAKADKQKLVYVVERRDITDGIGPLEMAFISLLAAAFGGLLACVIWPDTRQWEVEVAKRDAAKLVEQARADANAARATASLIYERCKTTED